jgi:hypothetical protein
MSNQSARALSHAPRLAGAIGTTQLTVNGWPMYTYVGDTKSSATTGQGKDLSGGLWWVVAPSGKWITKSGSSSGSASKTPAGRYGGSGY